MRAINPSKVREFVVPQERRLPPGEQTVWLCRGLTAEQYYEYQDEIVEVRGNLGGRDADPVTKVRSGKNEFNVLLVGIVGVRNFPDENGVHVDMPEGKHNAAPKKDFVSRIPPQYRKEIAKFIIGDSELTEDEAGNSDAQSGSLQPGTQTAMAEATPGATESSAGTAP